MDPIKELEKALGRGDVRAVRNYLMNGVDVNYVFEYGFTALMLASQNGHQETVKFLVDMEAMVDIQNKSGVTALMLASQFGHKDTVMILMDSNAQVDMQFNNGNTALHLASYNGRTDTVEYLIESNAKIDIKNMRGQTAIDLALENNHTEIVKLLRDLKTKMVKGRRQASLDLATQNDHRDIVNQLSDLKPRRQTSLDLATQNDHRDIVNQLSDLKPRRQTSLDLASQNDQRDIVNQLSDLKVEMDKARKPLPKPPSSPQNKNTFEVNPEAEVPPKLPPKRSSLGAPKPIPSPRINPENKSQGNKSKKIPPVPLPRQKSREGTPGDKSDNTIPTSPGIGLTVINSEDVKMGKVLGAGGFGTVYRATHINWGRVAVKRLSSVRLTESFRKEAEKMLRSLTSPYLVRIMGLIEKPDGVDIVMEFFENGSLKEFEQKYMKCDCLARKIKMIQDMAYGMNFLHTLNPPITHRDLKLENVFVGNGFAAKIGDFGLAVSSTQSCIDAGSAGTVSHMPPEAFDVNVTPDEPWDMYTFGITTYELTTGRDPWPQQKTHANERLIAIWVGKGHRPNLEVVPKDAPVEIVDMIKSCWAPEPNERPKFFDVLKTVTELFENNHENNLRRADRAISEQMDIVQEASERVSTSVDSGWGSLETWSLKGN